MNSSANLLVMYEEWFSLFMEKYIISAVVWSSLGLIAIPLWIFFYIYLSLFIVLAYEMAVQVKGENSESCIFVLGYLWDIFGRIWHGYEIHGIENLPDGPGVIIYYHAALPIDYILFLARIFLLKNRLQCHTVVDRFAFKLPGLRRLFKSLKMITGTKEECLGALRKGDWVAIAPGGTREALFSDETYKTMWGKRTGFAQVALEAKVPIIPMFTENSREGYRTLGKISILKNLYECIRWPVVPVYGGFPVKWHTHVGQPIPYDPNITAEELVEKAHNALRILIDKHQKQPASIRRSLLERFHHRKNE